MVMNELSRFLKMDVTESKVGLSILAMAMGYLILKVAHALWLAIDFLTLAIM
jgi:hypothetical protein